MCVAAAVVVWDKELFFYGGHSKDVAHSLRLDSVNQQMRQKDECSGQNFQETVTGLLFILFILLSGSMELWHIYTGVALSSAFAAIQSPAYKAAVSDLVSAELYSQASGLVQLAGSAQYLISPTI